MPRELCVNTRSSSRCSPLPTRPNDVPPGSGPCRQADAPDDLRVPSAEVDCIRRSSRLTGPPRAGHQRRGTGRCSHLRETRSARNAVATLLVAALRDLAERDDAPRVGAMADGRNWWRYGQDSFVALRPNAWHMPEQVTVVGWLSTFAEMNAVREAIDADPVLGTRVDTMVGAEFSASQRPLDWLLVEHLLEPMIIASRSYDFDEALFELQFNRLDAGLRADTIRFVEFVPLNGFTSGMADIA